MDDKLLYKHSEMCNEYLTYLKNEQIAEALETLCIMTDSLKVKYNIGYIIEGSEELNGGNDN